MRVPNQDCVGNSMKFIKFLQFVICPSLSRDTINSVGRSLPCLPRTSRLSHSTSLVPMATESNEPSWFDIFVTEYNLLFTNAQFITHTKRVHRRSSSHIYIFASTLFNNSNGQPLLVGCTIVVASVHICRESSPNLWRGETQAFEWLLPHPPPPLKKSVLHRCHTPFTYRDLNIRCFRVRVRINWP